MALVDLSKEVFLDGTEPALQHFDPREFLLIQASRIVVHWSTAINIEAVPDKDQDKCRKNKTQAKRIVSTAVNSQ